MSAEAISAIVSSTGTSSSTAAMSNDPHNDAPERRATPGATAQLLRVQTREFVRERRGFFTSLILPLGLSALFLGMAVLLPSPASGGGFDETVMAIVVFLTVSTAPLSATAASLADARARGTLRLLGTTPVGRARLVLTHVPARLGLVLAQLALLIGVGAALGFVPVAQAPAMLGVALLGVALFGSIGYLLGGLLPTAETAWNVSTLVQLVPFFLSGLIPMLSLLPDPVENTLSVVPTFFFADLLIGLGSSGESTHPVWLSVAVVAGTAALIAALAVRLFRWDQGEER
ncbi:ABC transporter permease [Nocardiopsis sp. HNM0947]|uniref:ABC transporter permease n=1 Tax=Nocardiopsis coralli TaxID=2772213 RepID=A0ABR9P4W6_9ACTN|nr:ABC transporter permease [Nocardiopsis coralli]MBE2998883.1 ABC transporter permease [Nocardiopsis coralli]